MPQGRDLALFADAALADELSARLDDELLAVHFTKNLAASNDFQAITLDFSVQIAAHDYKPGVDVAIEATGASNGDIAGRFNIPLDDAINMQS